MHSLQNQELKGSFLLKLLYHYLRKHLQRTCALLYECVSVRDKLPIRDIIEAWHARGSGKISPLKVCFSSLYCFSNYLILCEVVSRNEEITETIDVKWGPSCQRESATLKAQSIINFNMRPSNYGGNNLPLE